MYSSVVELIQATCQRQPERVAIEIIGCNSSVSSQGSEPQIDRLGKITYHELLLSISHCSLALCHLCGVPSKFREQCIAIVGMDSIESIVLQLSVMTAGHSFILISEYETEENIR